MTLAMMRKRFGGRAPLGDEIRDEMQRLDGVRSELARAAYDADERQRAFWERSATWLQRERKEGR